MSLTKSATRLALLAGASLTAIALTPTAALAANECGPLDPAPTADAVSCDASPPTYPNGIEYTSSGNLLLITEGAITGGTRGILVRNGGATDTLRVDTTAGLLTNPGGVGVDVVSTGSGAITVNTSTITTTTSGTHGIRAVSTGGAAISITTGGNTTISPSNLASSVAAIEARTTGGNGAVTINTTGTTRGTLHGIIAETSGTGAVTLNLNGTVQGSTATATPGIGILATSGGALTINASSNSLASANIAGTQGIVATSGSTFTLNLSGSTGASSKIRAVSVGNSTITQSAGRRISGGVDLTTGVSSLARITNDGTLGGPIRAAGGRVQIDNNNYMSGIVDFSGIQFTGSQAWVTFTINDGFSAESFSEGNLNSGGWIVDTGTSTFSDGRDLLSTTANGAIFVSRGIQGAASIPAEPVIFDFGDGNDTFNNAGLLALGADIAGYSVLTIENLETFNNSGVIRLGMAFEGGGPFGTLPAGPDGNPNDLLVMRGVTFNGAVNSADGAILSRLELDVDLAGGPQTHCAYTDSADLPLVADCVNLTDGTTTGVTAVFVNPYRPQGATPAGHYNPIGNVLVDVNGSGTSGVGHFVLASDTPNYRYDASLGRGVIAYQGLFFGDLVYDAENQRHILVTMPKQETSELASIAHTVQSLWRTSTGSWFDRQSEVRDAKGGDYAGGVWMRVSGDFANRDRVQSYSGAGNTWEFDTSYDQSTYAVTGGVDGVMAAMGGSLVGGFMLGYVGSNVDFAASTTTIDYRGGTLAAYGGFVSGPLFVDAMANATVVLMDLDPAGMGLAPGDLTTETVQSYGARVDAGYRLPIASGLWIEPLAGFAYVRSDLNGFGVPGATVDFENTNSIRAGLGARLGGGSDYSGFRASYALTARGWKELDGESAFAADNDGPDLVVTDAFDGTFGEVGLSISLANAGGGITGFVDGGLTVGDGFRSTNFSAGVRFNW